jgi:hypothetical protein
MADAKPGKVIAADAGKLNVFISYSCEAAS